MIDINSVKPSNLWYVIGLITADGCLSNDKRHINITSKDREHLHSVKKALYLDNQIGRKTRSKERDKRYSHLQFGDVRFYKYLLSLGITPRKSLTIGRINVDDEYFVDFLRGVIDGDGNISTWVHRTNRNHQWCFRIFSASFTFIEWLNEKIQNKFGVQGRLYSRKEKGKTNLIHILKFGKISASVILEQTYYPGSLSLMRKMTRVQLCLQQVN